MICQCKGTGDRCSIFIGYYALVTVSTIRIFYHELVSVLTYLTVPSIKPVIGDPFRIICCRLNFQRNSFTLNKINLYIMQILIYLR